MHGNVIEYCEGWIRGSSWNTNAKNCQTMLRSDYITFEMISRLGMGFRVVLGSPLVKKP